MRLGMGSKKEKIMKTESKQIDEVKPTFALTTLRLTWIAVICLSTGILIAIWVLLAGGYLKGTPIPDSDKAKEIQPFITGLVAPLLTLGSTLLIIANLKTTTEQNFSTNFFKLIDLHNKLVDGINTTVDNITSDASPSKGRSFFDDLALRIANDYESSMWQNYNPPSGKLALGADLIEMIGYKRNKELLDTIYAYYFEIHQSDLGHYFRNLFHIISFAERASVSTKTKIEHLRILRAQLSNYEILLLAYNGLHPYGAAFYPLIEKYELLKSLNTEIKLSPWRTKRIVDVKILVDAYPKLKAHLSNQEGLPKEWFT